MNSSRSITRYLKTVASRKKQTLGQFQPSEETAEKMSRPNFDAIEKHYGCEISAHLKRHFADHELLFTSDFEVASPLVRLHRGCHVRSFTALNAESVSGFFEGLENYIEIASGIIGGRFIVDPRETNPLVYPHFWDIGRDPEWFQDTGLRLKSFLFSPRYVSDYEEQFEIYE